MRYVSFQSVLLAAALTLGVCSCTSELHKIGAPLPASVESVESGGNPSEVSCAVDSIAIDPASERLAWSVYQRGPSDRRWRRNAYAATLEAPLAIRELGATSGRLAFEGNSITEDAGAARRDFAQNVPERRGAVIRMTAHSNSRLEGRAFVGVLDHVPLGDPVGRFSFIYAAEPSTDRTTVFSFDVDTGAVLDEAVVIGVYQNADTVVDARGSIRALIGVAVNEDGEALGYRVAARDGSVFDLGEPLYSQVNNFRSRVQTNEFYFVSSRRPLEEQVRVFDVSTGENRPADVDRLSARAIHAGVQHLLIDRDDELIGIVYAGSSPEIALRNRQLPRLNPNTSRELLSFGHGQIVFRDWSPARGAESFHFDLDSAELTGLGSLGCDPQPAPDTEIGRLTSQDGVDISYIVHHPIQPRADNATAVILHGGPHDADERHPNIESHAFLARGFRVFRVNYRGSRGFGGAHEAAGDLAFDGAMLDDIREALRDASQRGFVDDSAPRLLIGPSFGGLLSAQLASRRPEEWSGVLMFNPLLDIASFQASSFIQGNPARRHNLQILYGNADDPDIQARWLAVRFDRLADQIETPVFAILTRQDERIGSAERALLETAAEAYSNVCPPLMVAGPHSPNVQIYDPAMRLLAEVATRWLDEDGGAVCPSR